MSQRTKGRKCGKGEEEKTNQEERQGRKEGSVGEIMGEG